MALIGCFSRAVHEDFSTTCIVRGGFVCNEIAS